MIRRQRSAMHSVVAATPFVPPYLLLLVCVLSFSGGLLVASASQSSSLSLTPLVSWVVLEGNQRTWNQGLLFSYEAGGWEDWNALDSAFVCSPVPYDDAAQPFCVDSTVVSQPYAMAQPFYVLDLATTASAIPNSMIVLSRCWLGLDGKNNFYFGGYMQDMGSSACPQGTFDTDLGYVSLTRTTVFSQPLYHCDSPFLYSVTGNCGSYGNNGAYFFVVPLNTSQTQCTTFWCSSSSVCLASSSMVCDGIAHCAGGEDESLETCCRGKVCNSSSTHRPQCISMSNLCDGIVDCDDDSDESACYAWTPIMHNVRLDSAGLTLVTVNGGGYHRCVQEAVRASTTTFGFIEATSTCVVYGPADATIETRGDEYFASYMSYIASPGEVTYRQGTPDAITRTKCDPVMRCNGHGTADSSSCICSCDVGYYGPTCSQALIMDDEYSFVVVCDTVYPLDGDLYHNIHKVLIEGGLADFFFLDVLGLSAEAIAVSTLQVVFTAMLFPVAAGPQTVFWFKLKGASPQELSLCRTVIVAGGQNALLEARMKARLLDIYHSGGSSNPLVGNGRSYFQFIAPLTVPYTLTSTTAATAGTAAAWNVSVGYRTRQLQVQFFMSTWQSPVSSDGTATFPINVTYFSNISSSDKNLLWSEIQCTPTMTYNLWTPALSGYCAQVYCVADLLPEGPIRDVAYVTFDSITSSDSCGSLMWPLVDVTPDSSNALPPVAALSAVSVSKGDFSRFLAAGVATLCVAVIGIVVAAALFIIDDRSLRETFPESAAVASADATDALHSIMQYFTATISYYGGTKKGGGSQLLSTSVFIALFAANVAFAGMFLIIYFAMSTSTVRNGDVLLELYYTNNTNSSDLSPMPFLAFRIPSDDGPTCAMRSVAGTPSYPPFISAYCEGSSNASGAANIVIRAASTMTSCQATPERAIAGGTVLVASSVFPSFSDSVFVRFSCGPPHEVQKRFDVLTQLQQTSVADLAITEFVYPLELPTARRQHWDVTSSLSSSSSTTTTTTVKAEFAYHREQANTLSITTSSDSCRFETAHTADNASAMAASIGNVRVVVQLANEAFSVNTTLNDTATLLATVSDVGNLSADVLAHGTLDGDQPVGFAYNADVNSGFAKYHGVRGSFVDIGRYFVGEKDGDGFTISVYVQATNATKGFVYAATDAREYGSAGLSVLLRQIEHNIARGETQWYSANNGVYSALYVDAIARSVHFIYAGTPDSSSDATLSLGVNSTASTVQYVDLVWDVHAIDTEWLFNGAWHHLAVLLKVENAQVKAQLVVDGRTSASQHSWNQCVPRRPWEMSFLNINRRYPVMSASQELVWTSGVLYVGVLNGGVAKLEFYPALRDNFELWLGSTPAIREFNAMDTTRYVVLGALLVAAGIVFLGVLLLTSGVELYQTHKNVTASLEESSAAQYKALWAQKPRDDDGACYTPLLFAVARDWLDVDHMALDALLQELSKSSKDSARELVRILFSQRKLTGGQGDAAEASQQQQPLSSEWNAALLAVGQVIDGLPNEQNDKGNQLRQNSITNTHRSSRAQGDVVVDAGKLNFVSEQHVATQNGDTPLAASLTSEIKQMLNPVIIALQSVYIWLTTLPIPSLYHLGFGSFFSFLCIDWTAALSTIPPVATPLLQLFVGMLAVSLFYFALHHDEQRFAEYVGRYVLRREQLRALNERREVNGNEADVVKETKQTKKLQGATVVTGIVALDQVAANDDIALVERGCECDFHVTLLDLMQAQQVDQALDEGLQEKHLVKTNNGDTLRIVKEMSDGVELEPIRETRTDGAGGVASEGPYSCAASPPVIGCADDVAAKTKEKKLVVMDKLGGCCVRHHSRRMHSTTQTDVFPFASRAECCVVQNGSRCGCSVGRMYVCGESYNDDEGNARVCSYSLCQVHYRGSVIDGLLADALALKRGIAENGLVWIFASAALFIANALYTPFLKAALMIVACHPYMQCLFPQCWASPDRNFALGAYLSLVLIVFFGVGFPLSLTLLLRRRLRLLKSAFFAPEFDGAYGGELSTVLLDEWQRFSMTDPTALGTLYKSFELQWLFVPPMLCAWKIVLLVPPVFLESGTFQQSAAVAAAEFAYGVFLFVTEPAIAPIVDIMYKVGVAHQMLFLGVQNINIHYRYLGLSNLSGAMLALTGLYLVFCVFCIVWSKVAPAVTEARRVARVQKILATFNMPYSAATTLYVAPGTRTHSSQPTTTANVLVPIDSGINENHIHPFVCEEDVMEGEME